MKGLVCITCLLVSAGIGPVLANPGSGTLTLATPQTGINKLSIQVSASSAGLTASDTQTTNLSGAINASFDVDPTTGATTAMTLSVGDIEMTNMHFTLKALIFISVADLYVTGMGGTTYTPPPVPAPVTPAVGGGTFDAALHRILINRGTLTGAITATDPDTPIDTDFVSSPVEGAGMGNGNITMVPGASDSTHRTMQATIQIPVDFTNVLDLDGTAVTIKVKGTLKAAGPVRILLDPLPSPYLTWTASHFPGITDPAIIAPEADPDHDGQPNSLEFALGGNPENGAENAILIARVPDSGEPEAAAELILTIAVRAGTPEFAGSPSPAATADGFTCTIQGSGDLVDFTSPVLPVATEVSDLPPAPSGYEYRSFRMAGIGEFPAAGAFMRVAVTAEP